MPVPVGWLGVHSSLGSVNRVGRPVCIMVVETLRPNQLSFDGDRLGLLSDNGQVVTHLDKLYFCTIV